MSQQQREPTLLRSCEGVQIGKKGFLVLSEQLFIEGFFHILKGDGDAEIPAGFLSAMETRRPRLNADDISISPVLF
jgi:hypothetical protein